MTYYLRLPLFGKIVIGAILGIGVGFGLGQNAESGHVASDIILQLLRLLATPLIFFSLLQSVLKTNIQARLAGKLLWVLMSNSGVAALIGLIVAIAMAPGRHFGVLSPSSPPLTQKAFDPVTDLLGKIPRDFLNPFSNNDVIGIIVIGLALAFALKGLQNTDHRNRIKAIEGYVGLGMDATMKLLHAVFELVPIAVLAVVARIVGTTGIGPLVSMIWFVASVVIGLMLLVVFYMLRLRFCSWVRPIPFLRGGFDAFAIAFSTASSAATLPVTYACATENLGLKEESASLGIMVGGTFNHDGGAQYEAMAALFVAQAIGHHLTLTHQVVIVFMSVVASVCAAGIPEAGLVTMIAVFGAVHLPLEYIPMLLPIDWLLDRCRTTINVMGDLVATCIIDGKTAPATAASETGP